MEIIRISTESPLYAETERIWLESFPENERRDVGLHRTAVAGDGRFFYNAVIEDDSIGDCRDADNEAAVSKVQNPGGKKTNCASSEIVGRCRVIGMISWWALDGMIYGEHFAMSPSVRGQGLGENVFKEVTGKFLAQGLPFVFEVEAPSPDNPIAARRIRFYERCGMHLLDYPYFQPPYHKGDAPVPMRLMSSDPSVTPSLAAALIRTVYPAV